VGELINFHAVICKQLVTLKVCLNEKLIGLSKLIRTQRNIRLLCAVLKMISYSS